MEYKIIGKNIKITKGIKEALKNKLEKFERYFDGNDVSCRAVARTYPVGTKLEITIFTPQMILRAEVTNPDLYNAMDEAIEKLDAQMRKLKTRMNRRKKNSLSESIVFENIKEESKKAESDEVVRTKSFYLNPMSIDEAVTRMEALDHDFFLYFDKDDERISVVYRRYDGGYGVLEAENKLK